MKKNIIMLMIVAIVMSICGCTKKAEAEPAKAQNTTSRFERMMFFDKYRSIRANESIEVPRDIKVDIKTLGTVLSLFEEDSRISKAFDDAKEDIRLFFGGADFFDWECFENTKLKQMREEYFTIEGQVGGSDAMYLPPDNLVVVYAAMKNYPYLMTKEVIAHELIHALTENEATSENPALYEGLTEILSGQLYQNETSGYGIACNYVIAYMRVLGVEDATKNILNGTVFADINSKTRPNAMEDASKSIYALDLGYGVEEDLLVSIDLLANYAINTGTAGVDFAAGIKEIQWSNPEYKRYFEWLFEQEGGDNIVPQ